MKFSEKGGYSVTFSIWLFDCQLDLLNEIHNDYIGIGKAVDSNDPIPPIQMPRGYGGVAILWKKELDSLITSLKKLEMKEYSVLKQKEIQIL